MKEQFLVSSYSGTDVLSRECSHSLQTFPVQVSMQTLQCPPSELSELTRTPITYDLADSSQGYGVGVW